MKGYVKGYYGYKNFGDELLVLGLLEYIQDMFDFEEIVVETQDGKWLSKWIEGNRDFAGVLAKKISYHELPRGKWGKLKFFLKSLWKDPYGGHYKCFGGGEVLSPERPIPHDGWNLYLGHRLWKKCRKYSLFGGFGVAKKKLDFALYNRILPRAERIVCREADSYETVKKTLGEKAENVILYQDFSTSVLEKAKPKISTYKTQIENKYGKYVLINMNSHARNEENRKKILAFVKKYPECKKIYFPCDMQDDVKFFEELSEIIPGLASYGWTQHSLIEILALFAYADAGIGPRLHFLYPLKFFGIKLEAMVYNDKVRKLILA